MTYFYKKGSPNPISYPVTDLGNLTPGSNLHSPKIGDPHGLPAPAMPGSIAFEDELAEVLGVRMRVIENRMPYEFLAKYHPRADYDPRKVPEPIRRAGLQYNAKNMVRLVHMDRPIDIGLACWNYLVATGATLVAPETGFNDFINRVPDAHLVLAQKICDSMDRCFEAKYFYGKPRPEEAFARTGLPWNITGYDEGCPNHPAYPAGHGAAAGSVSVLFTHFNTTQQQRNEVIDACYVWAMSRTLAGVHYAVDNLAGLAIGGMGSFDGTSWTL